MSMHLPNGDKTIAELIFWFWQDKTIIILQVILMGF
jgi:hypothetical protein